MPDQIARLERPSDGVGLVTLDLMSSGGFLSWAAVNALADAMVEAREGGSRVTVLASAMAGHWYEHAWLPDLIATVTGEATSGDSQGWWNALREITRPEVVSIAAINGDCSGGGAELGWACDLRVAEEQAWFSQPESQISVATGIGGSSRLARLIGRTATAEMVLDGAPMSADRIHQLGGVNRVVPSGTAVDAAVEWASRLAGRPAASLVALKRMLNDNENMGLTDALRNEQDLFGVVAASPEGVEGMRQVQARYDAGESVRDLYGSPRQVHS